MTRETTTPATTVYIASTNPDAKSGTAVCSLPCLARWARATRIPFVFGISTPSPICTYCAGCGMRTARPADCLLHGDACPPSDWTQTPTAAAILKAVHRRTGLPVTDQQVDTAYELVAVHPEYTAGETALRVVERTG